MDTIESLRAESDDEDKFCCKEDVLAFGRQPTKRKRGNNDHDDDGWLCAGVQIPPPSPYQGIFEFSPNSSERGFPCFFTGRGSSDDSSCEGMMNKFDKLASSAEHETSSLIYSDSYCESSTLEFESRIAQLFNEMDKVGNEEESARFSDEMISRYVVCDDDDFKRHSCCSDQGQGSNTGNTARVTSFKTGSDFETRRFDKNGKVPRVSGRPIGMDTLMSTCDTREQVPADLINIHDPSADLILGEILPQLEKMLCQLSTAAADRTDRLLTASNGEECGSLPSCIASPHPTRASKRGFMPCRANTGLDEVETSGNHTDNVDFAGHTLKYHIPLEANHPNRLFPRKEECLGTLYETEDERDCSLTVRSTTSQSEETMSHTFSETNHSNLIQDAELRELLSATQGGQNASMLFPAMSEDSEVECSSDDGMGDEWGALGVIHTSLQVELEKAEQQLQIGVMPSALRDEEQIREKEAISDVESRASSVLSHRPTGLDELVGAIRTALGKDTSSLIQGDMCTELNLDDGKTLSRIEILRMAAKQHEESKEETDRSSDMEESESTEDAQNTTESLRKRSSNDRSQSIDTAHDRLPQEVDGAEVSLARLITEKRVQSQQEQHDNGLNISTDTSANEELRRNHLRATKIMLTREFDLGTGQMKIRHRPTDLDELVGAIRTVLGKDSSSLIQGDMCNELNLDDGETLSRIEILRMAAKQHEESKEETDRSSDMEESESTEDAQNTTGSLHKRSSNDRSQSIDTAYDRLPQELEGAEVSLARLSTEKRVQSQQEQHDIGLNISTDTSTNEELRRNHLRATKIMLTREFDLDTGQMNIGEQDAEEDSVLHPAPVNTARTSGSIHRPRDRIETTETSEVRVRIPIRKPKQDRRESIARNVEDRISGMRNEQEQCHCGSRQGEIKGALNRDSVEGETCYSRQEMYETTMNMKDKKSEKISSDRETHDANGNRNLHPYLAQDSQDQRQEKAEQFAPTQLTETSTSQSPYSHECTALGSNADNARSLSYQEQKIEPSVKSTRLTAELWGLPLRVDTELGVVQAEQGKDHLVAIQGEVRYGLDYGVGGLAGPSVEQQRNLVDEKDEEVTPVFSNRTKSRKVNNSNAFLGQRREPLNNFDIAHDRQTEEDEAASLEAELNMPTRQTQQWVRDAVKLNSHTTMSVTRMAMGNDQIAPAMIARNAFEVTPLSRHKNRVSSDADEQTYGRLNYNEEESDNDGNVNNRRDAADLRIRTSDCGRTGEIDTAHCREPPNKIGSCEIPFDIANREAHQETRDGTKPSSPSQNCVMQNEQRKDLSVSVPAELLGKFDLVGGRQQALSGQHDGLADKKDEEENTREKDGNSNSDRAGDFYQRPPRLPETFQVPETSLCPSMISVEVKPTPKTQDKSESGLHTEVPVSQDEPRPDRLRSILQEVRKEFYLGGCSERKICLRRDIPHTEKTENNEKRERSDEQAENANRRKKNEENYRSGDFGLEQFNQLQALEGFGSMGKGADSLRLPAKSPSLSPMRNSQRFTARAGFLPFQRRLKLPSMTIPGRQRQGAVQLNHDTQTPDNEKRVECANLENSTSELRPESNTMPNVMEDKNIACKEHESLDANTQAPSKDSSNTAISHPSQESKIQQVLPTQRPYAALSDHTNTGDNSQAVFTPEPIKGVHGTCQDPPAYDHMQTANEEPAFDLKDTAAKSAGKGAQCRRINIDKGGEINDLQTALEVIQRLRQEIEKVGRSNSLNRINVKRKMLTRSPTESERRDLGYEEHAMHRAYQNSDSETKGPERAKCGEIPSNHEESVTKRNDLPEPKTSQMILEQDSGDDSPTAVLQNQTQEFPYPMESSNIQRPDNPSPPALNQGHEIEGSILTSAKPPGRLDNGTQIEPAIRRKTLAAQISSKLAAAKQRILGEGQMKRIVREYALKSRESLEDSDNGAERNSEDQSEDMLSLLDDSTSVKRTREIMNDMMESVDGNGTLHRSTLSSTESERPQIEITNNRNWPLHQSSFNEKRVRFAESHKEYHYLADPQVTASDRRRRKRGGRDWFSTLEDVVVALEDKLDQFVYTCPGFVVKDSPRMDEFPNR